MQIEFLLGCQKSRGQVTTAFLFMVRGVEASPPTKGAVEYRGDCEASVRTGFAMTGKFYISSIFRSSSRMLRSSFLHIQS